MTAAREPSPRLLRELSALADGSLPPARRAALEARVAAEPELAAIVAEQRRAVDAVRADLPAAPAELRARIEAMQARAQKPPRRRWLLPAGGGALAAAAVAVALVLLIGGDPSSPTIVDAAALTVKPATAPAPKPAERRPVLEASVGGIAFPDWAAAFGWKAVGRRVDTLDGRRTVTVFYAKGSERIGYAIVDGTALAWPHGAKQTVRNGTDVRSIGLSGRTVVTWRRDGHSCVISAGPGVSRAELVALAAWRDGGSLIY
jgi:ferric-dicitrate binding protein FerR (iron transport regulator)